MTTRSGARIYRRAPKPLQPGACPQCTRVIAINPSGRRRSHFGTDGHPCPGGRVFVGDPERVILDELPEIVMPAPRGRPPREPREPRDDPRECICGWRPRRKKDGTFAAHRVEPDDPTAPYCPNGSARTY